MSEVKPRELDYEEAARVTHLYLEKWCDTSLRYPDMVADASRKVRDAYDKLAAEIELRKIGLAGVANLHNDLAVQMEILKSKASQFESTLKATMEARDAAKAENERLKEDLSNVRQCYYEVVEQRNKALADVAKLEGAK
jgi:outer membrane murein-binding lipoprotein Lpp